MLVKGFSYGESRSLRVNYSSRVRETLPVSWQMAPTESAVGFESSAALLAAACPERPERCPGGVVTFGHLAGTRLR